MSDPVMVTETGPETIDVQDDIHPAAKPFLFLGREKVKRNFIWLPLIGLILASILGVIYPQKHPAPWEIVGGVSAYEYEKYSGGSSSYVTAVDATPGDTTTAAKPVTQGTPIPGSWAIFGFIAYSLIVFAAPALFSLLAREEDYYGEGGLPDPDVSTDPMITGEAHHD